MSEYIATVRWQNKDDASFQKNRYSREHVWEFDGGVTVPASSSPQVVPVPLSSEKAVDPEEALVASVSSCHMLWFLSLAAKAGYVVESYIDNAKGTMSKNAEGKVAITSISLFPKTVFSGTSRPDATQLEGLHHAAHEACFIANSIKAEIKCFPQQAST